MYIQIELITFLQLKLIIENAKKIYEGIFKLVLKNLKKLFLKRKLKESTCSPTYLQISNPVIISYSSGALHTINSFPDDIDNQNNSILEACLNRMPAIQRNAFVYKTFEGRNTSLICSDLNINEAVFWKLIQNARKELIYNLDLN